MKKSTSAEKRGTREQSITSLDEHPSSFRESSREPRKVGRPPLYKTPEELEKAIEAYFAKKDAEAKERGFIDAIYYKSELALFLGFKDRNALDEYRQKPEFSRTIKKAEFTIEMSKERALPNRQYATAGIIFDLVNNYGYINTRSNSSVEITEEDKQLDITINFVKPEPQE